MPESHITTTTTIPSLNTKIWGWLLNILVRVDHMYSVSPFNSI